jgi:hypothetical protein
MLSIFLQNFSLFSITTCVAAATKAALTAAHRETYLKVHVKTALISLSFLLTIKTSGFSNLSR